MGPIGIWELVMILLILVLIFGASRLAGIGKGLGEAISNFKSSLKSSDDKNQKDGKEANLEKDHEN